MSAPVESWRDKVALIVEDEQDENVALHMLTAFSAVPPAGPVLVIVHPGDASDEPGIDDGLETMLVTLRERGNEGLVIVLHRFSSAYMNPDHAYAVPESCACQDWFEAVAELCDRPHTVQFYGDILEDFCDRVAPRLAGASDVLVTGLWGDEEDGCAATVARALARHGLPARLDPSSPRAWERASPGP